MASFPRPCFLPSYWPLRCGMGLQGAQGSPSGFSGLLRTQDSDALTEGRGRTVWGRGGRTTPLFSWQETKACGGWDGVAKRDRCWVLASAVPLLIKWACPTGQWGHEKPNKGPKGHLPGPHGQLTVPLLNGSGEETWRVPGRLSRRPSP